MDKESPIFDFYPADFQVDQNDKKQSWEAITLVPFIDEKRLIEAIKNHAENMQKSGVVLCERDQQRNSLCLPKLISRCSNPTSPALQSTLPGFQINTPSFASC
jgi:5'-3' exoribonuclease 2